MTSLDGIVAQSLRHLGLQAPHPPQTNAMSPPVSSVHPNCNISPVQMFHHQFQPSPTGNIPMKLDKAMFSRGGGGGGGGGGGTSASPPPVSSNPENNACKWIDYRGTKVAAFNVDGRELICLPQAFELFLKHLVGGLHTVYTKLKRLDVVPVVCNVEQVRVLRGLGAIQPGVNRCKLISPKEFDILYDDCTNSSARPGRPPKRSALAVTPDGLDKLKKNRLQMGTDFYSPAALMDAKKSLAFGNNYMAFSELQKTSPLITTGFPYPPHLAHLAFMPLGHPGMMNLAMATHLSMRADHLVSSAHDRIVHGPDVTSTRGRDERQADNVIQTTSSPKEHNNNNNNHRPNIKLISSDFDRPLNLEVQKKPEVVRPSSSTDHDSVATTASDHNPTSGQFDLSKKSLHPYGNGIIGHYGNDERHYGNDFRLSGNVDHADHERPYRNDRMDSDDESTDDISEDGQDCSVSLQGYPCKRSANGDVGDKVANQNMPGYFTSDLSNLETLLMNIQGLIKMATEKACQKEQQINFEKADLKMKAAKERELRESLEKELMEERRKKAILQKKLKKERRTCRNLQSQFQQSIQERRGQGTCYLPLPVLSAPPTSAPGELGSGGENRDDMHVIKDNRRLMNEVTVDSEIDGSCGSDGPEQPIRQDERPNSIHILMESFIESTQKSNVCGLSNNGYNHPPSQPPPMKSNEMP